ncbi:MAG: PD40 domain-containing protein [Planctomycetes bacterium]|nr:PD40 domain-containing protein [Planctomycetota bacterium]
MAFLNQKRWIRRIVAVGSAVAIVVLHSNLQAKATPVFTGMGDLPGGEFNTSAEGVSADGSVVVGTASSANGWEAYRWTRATGIVGLGDLPTSAFDSGAHAISADGSTIVGTSRTVFRAEAFRWTEATGMQGIGVVSEDDVSSEATAVSADGSVIAGHRHIATSVHRYESFRWTEGGGMTDLGSISGTFPYDKVNAMSADGSQVVGFSFATEGGANQAFRWNESEGIVGMGDIPSGGLNSHAKGMSADGTYVVGWGTNGPREPFRWSAATGMVGLGVVSGTGDTAFDISDDGSIVVGGRSASSLQQQSLAFIWDQRHGKRNLQQLLTNNYGLDLTGWSLVAARAVSADGSTIIGTGYNPSGQWEGWIVQGVPEPSTLCLLFPVIAVLSHRRRRS